MATRRQLMGLGGFQVDTLGNLVAYSGAFSDLFVNPAAGDFRIKDASVPSGIGASGSGAVSTSVPTETSPPVSSGSGISIGLIAALGIGALILLSD